MALMESPAIIICLILANMGERGQNAKKLDLKHTLHEAFFNGSILILLGSLLIGASMNPKKAADFQIFVYDIFKGFLCFFLLDLGMSAARQLKELKNNVAFLTTIAILVPFINAVFGLLIAKLIGLDSANGFLFMILLASASYIAVPAAVKTNLPLASPAYFLSMSLGLTFPINILVGMPIYWELAQKFLPLSSPI